MKYLCPIITFLPTILNSLFPLRRSMAAVAALRRLQKDSLKGLSFMLISLALTSSLLLFLYSCSIHQEGQSQLPLTVSIKQQQKPVKKKGDFLPEKVAVIRPPTSNGDEGDQETPSALDGKN